MKSETTYEYEQNFYCKNCNHIKDYMDDNCENCYTEKSGYFKGFEMFNNPLFEEDFK